MKTNDRAVATTSYYSDDMRQEMRKEAFWISVEGATHRHHNR